MQYRVITALVVDETDTRYGRENIGLLWIIGDPILFVAGVTIAWSAMRPTLEHGLPMPAIVLLGGLAISAVAWPVDWGLVYLGLLMQVAFSDATALLAANASENSDVVERSPLSAICRFRIPAPSPWSIGVPRTIGRSCYGSRRSIISR